MTARELIDSTAGRFLASGDKGQDVATDYHVSIATISNIKKGKIWKHVP